MSIHTQQVTTAANDVFYLTGERRERCSPLNIKLDFRHING